MPVKWLVVEVLTIALATVAGELSSCFAGRARQHRRRVVWPLRCRYLFVAVSLVFQEDNIDEPGAKRSTQVPMFEKSDLASVLVLIQP